METLTDDTLRDRENVQFGELATKNDIATLKHEMEKQESRIRQEIAELKADITKSIVYALIAMTGIFAAIVKLF